MQQQPHAQCMQFGHAQAVPVGHMTACVAGTVAAGDNVFCVECTVCVGS